MIIVTGGSGFIGSNLVSALQSLKNKTDIVVCDDFGQDDKWRNLAKSEIRDIVSPAKLFDYIENHIHEIKVIFHMGAISSTTEKDVDKIMDNNFVLSRRLWRLCAQHNIRLIYASSAATYGDGLEGFKDEETIEALAKLKPLNAYGWSKHLFDRRALRIVENRVSDETESIPAQWVGLKFFNVYGPNEYHKGEQMSVICKLYPQVVAGASAKLFKSHDENYEDGGQMRDFIYVKDCVSVMLWLLDNPNVNGLFNVGTGKARSFKDLALSVFKATNDEPKINYIDMPLALQNKYQYFTQADMQKLKDAGYTKEFTSLEDGVKDYVQRYLSQDDIYV